MTRGRWFEIEEDVAAAVRHFARAVQLHGRGGAEEDTLDGYAAAMALMHAMQAGHTSLESALVRTLRLLDEEVPAGADWHADLLRRAAHAVEGRPALLPPDLAEAADETRRFRHVAMRSYDSFSPGRAVPAIRAAEVLAQSLSSAFRTVRASLDPPTRG